MMVFSTACASATGEEASPPLSPNAPAYEAEQEAVRAARAEWNRLALAHDTSAIRALVADSFTAVSPYLNFRGRDPYIRTLGEIFFERTQSTLRYDPTDVVVSHALGRVVAAEEGEWEAAWIRGGEPTAIGGPYLVLWERSEGQWRMTSETFIVTRCIGESYCRR